MYRVLAEDQARQGVPRREAHVELEQDGQVDDGEAVRKGSPLAGRVAHHAAGRLERERTLGWVVADEPQASLDGHLVQLVDFAVHDAVGPEQPTVQRYKVAPAHLTGIVRRTVAASQIHQGVA
jgi:hypothetical protein